MRRVRRRFVLILCFILNYIWISSVNADCIFEGKTHQENEDVPTAEPCLNCKCKHGALVCYLRVCTKLPDPPPQGCIIVHRHRACCPELICADQHGSGSIQGRSETNDLDDINQRLFFGSACIDNGTVYSPGSAMSSSSVCEYCYCIGGRQSCIKPKCLLNLEGCTPKFEHRSCCPIRYNCTGYYENDISSTTLQTPTKEPMVRGGCIISGVYHVEGSRVVGVGHSACDNCYCLRGVLRCEPLSCAPHILGCTPVIKPGECCPASYSCNGTIEVQPEPNYGKFPVISKEYAKLSKEVQRHKPIKLDKPLGKISNITHYVLADSSSSTTTKAHRDVSGTRFTLDPNTTGPLVTTKWIDSFLDMRTRPSTAYKKNLYETTNYNYEESTQKKLLLVGIEERKPGTTYNGHSTTVKTTPTTIGNSIESDFFSSLFDTLFSNEINSTDTTSTSADTIPDSSTSAYSTSTLHDDITDGYSLNITDVISTLLSTLEDFGSTVGNEESSTITNTTDEIEYITNATTDYQSFTLNANTSKAYNKTITLVKTIDCNNSIGVEKSNTTEKTTYVQSESSSLRTQTDKHLVLNSTEDFTTTKSVLTSQSTPVKDITEIDVESRVKVDNITVSPLRKIPPEVEDILGLPNKKDKDYVDYDYNEPTLPPSLPNLRIIPFVAADALVTKTSNSQISAAFPSASDRIDGEPPAFNLFSPPTKTEGGFVPKSPSVFDNVYHHTPIANLHITTTNPTKSYENNCIVNEREVKHGETVKSESCVMCICFFGNVVCQYPQCPLPISGCKLSDEVSMCCRKIICDSDMNPNDIQHTAGSISTTQTIITLSENLLQFNHYGDSTYNETKNDEPPLVSGTDPRSNTSSNANTENSKTEALQNNTNSFSFDNVWDLLFNSEPITGTVNDTKIQSESNVIAANESTTATAVVNEATSAKAKISEKNPIISNELDSTIGVGLLKLAGCNIYGRMYRVGKIISELSNPCLECKCTDVGVQCTTQKC